MYLYVYTRNRYCEAYLLKLLLVLFPVALLHMPFLGFGTAECDEALETLQVFMLVWEGGWQEEIKEIRQRQG